jgi:MobA/VirD2-like, nuclease domain
MARYLDRPDHLQPDLRFGFVRRAQGNILRLPTPFRALGARGRSVPPAPEGSRHVIVKSWLAKPTTTAGHLHYLQQGKGFDGQDAALFSRAGAVVDPRTFARDAADDPHQYRLIVSLRDGDRLDLTAYTQRLMRQVERDLLGPVEWIGATHHDTAHVHTHLIIRGRDPAGQELYIRPRYLSRGLRARAQTLATDVLGSVPSHLLVDERQRTQGLERFVDGHVFEAKRAKGDAMDDPRDPSSPAPTDGETLASHGPIGSDVKPAAALALQERMAVLQVAVAQKLQRDQTQELGRAQDRGLGL